jgi:uncharacterized protein YdeI (YjbR/CyaY-like superfamily)
MATQNPKVDWYFDKDSTWQKEVTKLRSIILSCDLQEDVKWGCPCYSVNGNNILLIHMFKNYCAILFFKGSLLKDTSKILIQQTEFVQVRRQIRFTNLEQIMQMEATIREYVLEAIDVEKSGVEPVMKKTAEFTVPDEFRAALDDNPALQDAFASLTPGRQRAYLLYFGGAKQVKTREERVEKYIDRILDGLGLDD